MAEEIRPTTTMTVPSQMACPSTAIALYPTSRRPTNRGAPLSRGGTPQHSPSPSSNGELRAKLPGPNDDTRLDYRTHPLRILHLELNRQPPSHPAHHERAPVTPCHSRVISAHTLPLTRSPVLLRDTSNHYMMRQVVLHPPVNHIRSTHQDHCIHLQTIQNFRVLNHLPHPRNSPQDLVALMLAPHLCRNTPP